MHRSSWIVAGAALLVRAIASSPQRLMLYAALGAVLGLGLLTKATMLPFVAAVFIILAVPLLRSRKDADGAARTLAGLAILAAVTLAISGWWYVTKYLETGSWIGSHDVAQMEAHGGLIAGLLKNADLRELARIPWLLVQSFLWAGTWSFVFPPRIALFALVATTGLIAFGALLVMRRKGPGRDGWLALVTLGLFVAALVRHALVLATTGSGIAAWYLHAFAPVLASLVALCLTGLAPIRGAGRWLPVLLIYPLLFLALATAINTLFFAGCGTTLPNLRYFDLASAAGCATDLTATYRNLAVLSLPGAFVPLFAAGWLLCFTGVLAALNALRANAHTSIVSTR